MHATTVQCPVCEADVVVELHYWPGEKATRDYPGSPESFSVANRKWECPNGCHLSTNDFIALEEAAEQAAKDYRPEHV